MCEFKRSQFLPERRRTSGMIPLAVLMLSGCVAVGPDYVRPGVNSHAEFLSSASLDVGAQIDPNVGQQQRLNPERDVGADWWTEFGSAELNELVEESLRNNPDLDAAQAALRKAQEEAASAGGALFPRMDVLVSHSRQQNVIAATGRPGVYSLAGASVAVAYDMDVFGGIRRSVEAMDARAEGRGYELEAAYLSLSANVVTAVITEASLREQLQAIHALIDTQRAYLHVLETRHAAGDVSLVEVASQRAIVAQTQATLPPRQKRLAQQRHRLAIYLGRFPTEFQESESSLIKLALPNELPLAVPSALLNQRPDIRAAEANLKRANADIGVAIADLLPRLSLSAGYGSRASQIGDLFSTGSILWNLLGSAAQNVFDGGRLTHRRHAAEADFQQAAAVYRSVAMNAFGQVVDTLTALESDAALLQAEYAAEVATEQSLRIAQGHFDAGAGDQALILIAQAKLLNARLGRINAQALRLNNTVALYQALGGGWWNRKAPLADAQGGPGADAAHSQ